MKNGLGRRNGGRYTIKQMLKLGGQETGHTFFYVMGILKNNQSKETVIVLWYDL